tara:strand:+ start:237 stop:437 length:201 start_codon:yes stop_codon:yes gene_type:complete
LKLGDIVQLVPYEALSRDRVDQIALVVELGIDMWGEEMIPSGIKLLWPDGEMDIVYSDEVFSVNCS